MNGNGKLQRSEQLKARTKDFAFRVVQLFKTLPRYEEARIIGRQLVRSGTSIGANYRAACRARTAKEFASKVRIAVEEADETAYWIELLIHGEIFPSKRLEPLWREANELLAILAASLNTVESRIRKTMAR